RGTRHVSFLEQRVEVHEEVEIHRRQVHLAHRRDNISFAHGVNELLSLARSRDFDDLRGMGSGATNEATAQKESKRVAIIGAGISGLAHADVLERCGFSVVLFERAPRLGGVWAAAYPDVSLQNTWWGYHLSSFPWPFAPDEHPTGVQILRYLEA